MSGTRHGLAVRHSRQATWPIEAIPRKSWQRKGKKRNERFPFADPEFKVRRLNPSVRSRTSIVFTNNSDPLDITLVRPDALLVLTQWVRITQWDAHWVIRFRTLGFSHWVSLIEHRPCLSMERCHHTR